MCDLCDRCDCVDADVAVGVGKSVGDREESESEEEARSCVRMSSYGCVEYSTRVMVVNVLQCECQAVKRIRISSRHSRC